MHIQWYPGHMAKAKRLLKDQIKAVDIVIEIRDARIPFSSTNQDLITLIGDKPRIVVLNKVDLADIKRLNAWEKILRQDAFAVIKADSLQRKGMKSVLVNCQEASKEMLKKRTQKGLLPRAVRAMVIGIPNVGKSSFINAMVKKGSAKTGNKPGVTRGNQWVRILNDIELLDTPGILWPRFENQKTGEYLAYTGAISEKIFDVEEASLQLISMLRDEYPGMLTSFYGLDSEDNKNYIILNDIGMKRFFLDKKGEVQTERTALRLLHDFQEGKLGNYTLDKPEVVGH